MSQDKIKNHLITYYNNSLESVISIIACQKSIYNSVNIMTTELVSMLESDEMEELDPLIQDCLLNYKQISLSSMELHKCIHDMLEKRAALKTSISSSSNEANDKKNSERQILDEIWFREGLERKVTFIRTLERLCKPNTDVRHEFKHLLEHYYFENGTWGGYKRDFIRIINSMHKCFDVELTQPQLKVICNELGVEVSIDTIKKALSNDRTYGKKEALGN